MISNSQAGLLRRGNSQVDPEDKDCAADLAILERQKFVRVSRAISGPIAYWKTDLGHAALRDFDDLARATAAEKTIRGRSRRMFASLWTLLNSNLIAGAIGTVLGFVLGKIF